MKETELYSLALKGWRVGPEETETDFEKRRALYSSDLVQPDQGHQKIQALFACCPLWIQASYSNVGLAFWQGGCTWTEGNKLKLQLRKSFQRNSKHLFYTKEEILSHEYVHAIRMAFQEPIFEEFFSYQTASTSFRRFFGPFFRTPRESSLFIYFLAISFVANLVSPFAIWMWGVFTIILGCGLFRLCRAHRLFKSCLRKFEKMTGSKEMGLSLMLSLTDQEIKQCAKMHPEAIVSYFYGQKETSLRHQQIVCMLNQ